MTKIGIPRALHYYRYFPLWKTFFEELGAEVLISPETNQEILSNGLKHSLDELCLPIKLYYGHVSALIPLADHIFIPRMMSEKKRTHTCPKMIGLPDMIKASIPDIPSIISPTFNRNKVPLFFPFLHLGFRFTKNPSAIHRAYQKALREQQSYEKLLSSSCQELGAQEKKTLKIALISHPYNICDIYINQDIIGKLKDMGVNILTAPMLPKETIEHATNAVFPKLRWGYERELLGAALSFAKSKKVDGIILLMSFGCGPGSLVGEYIERLIRNQFNLPFMSLVLDEHTSETGLLTRLEAFLDMIKIKNSKSEILNPKQIQNPNDQNSKLVLDFGFWSFEIV